MKFSIKVVTKSSQAKLELQPDGSYKAWLTKPAVDGQANGQLVKLLAAQLGVARSRLVITKGLTGKNKIVEVS